MTLVMERAHELASDIGEVSAVGWHGPANMDFDEWMRVGNTLQQVGNSINWWVGDWLNYGEKRYGETYAQAVEITGWEAERLMNAKWVASAIQTSLRKENLSWSAHKEVAKLPHEEQRFWLNKASIEGMKVRELRDAIRQSQLPPPAPVDDVPFSSATPRVASIHTNGNGYHAPINEYEQQSSEWEESRNGYTWSDDTEPVLSVVDSIPHIARNSGNNEWYTPAEYINAACAVLGTIDLDPASNDAANDVVKAAQYYTVETDGLAHEWRGNVWMNPPYSAELIGRFCAKLAHHYNEGDVTQAVVLVNNATETGWFADLVSVASAIVFPRSRVRFWKPDGELGAPLQGQAVIYMGGNPGDFLREFRAFGWGVYVD